MMTSYRSSLLIASSRETVLQDDIPDLSDLVRLGLGSLRLQVQNLRDAIHRENVVAPLGSLVKSQVTEQETESLRRDVRISGPAEDLGEGFGVTIPCARTMRRLLP